MKLTDKEIKRIIKKYKSSFNALEEYDKTGKLPLLSKESIKKLKKFS